MVTVKAYATQVVIVADEQSIGTHARSFSRGKACFNPMHYVPLLERKPGALRNGAPFKDWKLPRPIQTVKDKLLKRKGGDKECAGIFMAMLEHGVEAVSVACDLALTDKTVNRDHIINILNRLASTKPPEPIDIPDALQLKQAPKADCQSYDQLLIQTKTQPYSEEHPC